ncbi:hypothetical protein V494_03600 [Pseudogymnoascus sp. VKM F-4513 (FW-928)]|nr:hypothetical protein V494_03600 [Pseudogymnoascus sp. VKM F-4513 (FW-928)]
MHSDIQERARREEQQHAGPPLAVFAVHAAAAAEDVDEEPGCEGAEGGGEGEDYEVAARGALGEALFEEDGGEAECCGGFVEHYGEEDEEA